MLGPCTGLTGECPEAFALSSPSASKTGSFPASSCELRILVKNKSTTKHTINNNNNKKMNSPQHACLSTRGTGFFWCRAVVEG